jgi:hypothetical protein
VTCRWFSLGTPVSAINKTNKKQTNKQTKNRKKTKQTKNKKQEKNNNNKRI